MFERFLDRLRSAFGGNGVDSERQSRAYGPVTDPEFLEILEWIPADRLILDPGEIRVY